MLNETLYNETLAVLFVVLARDKSLSWQALQIQMEKEIQKEENTANKFTAKPQTKVRAWAYVRVSHTHLSPGNFTTPGLVCNLIVWVCVGKHTSLTAVIPTSIISISHSSLSYRGWAGWVIEVEEKHNLSNIIQKTFQSLQEATETCYCSAWQSPHQGRIFIQQNLLKNHGNLPQFALCLHFSNYLFLSLTHTHTAHSQRKVRVGGQSNREGTNHNPNRQWGRLQK